MDRNASDDARGVAEGRFTANDRLKEAFGSCLWGSIIAAVALHFLAISFFPPLTAADWRGTVHAPEVFDLIPDIELPPEPEPIARPAAPVISETDIDPDVTIPYTSWDENPPDAYGPPPADEGIDLTIPGAFIPHTVAPELRNPDRVRSALVREYPSALRNAGIGGTVQVHFFVSALGEVERIAIHRSSGHPQLDAAALRVAESLEFHPALNRDERVGVWVSIPFTFRTRRD